ncbi:hypothetical protein KGA66_02820 [Actinocrinis puniceicyclus]|uniref:Uncharacterized protein n=1 Tax=Actinocrinis puniceicyclus TaxID=977794 RepID=A0A8J7WGR2_9ACTN|nr:hypothetical protein [Actinocrinis puniceicyclus]MBS2961966.1 hypothetical protein [Actinocrinis puniceicyclus]
MVTDPTVSVGRRPLVIATGGGAPELLIVAMAVAAAVFARMAVAAATVRRVARPRVAGRAGQVAGHAVAVLSRDRDLAAVRHLADDHVAVLVGAVYPRSVGSSEAQRTR